jgi:hypothetical protein
VISPYARPHTIDHQQYDFASILRYIEDKYHLAPMGPYDRVAHSIAGDLDFNQTPLPPLTLQTRTCPPGANAGPARLIGQVTSTINQTAQRAILIKTATSPDSFTLELVQNSQLLGRDGKTLPLMAVQKGDHLQATAVPTPDKALVYLSQTMTDLDEQAVHDEIGFVTRWNSSNGVMTVHVSGNVLAKVNLMSHTTYAGPYTDWGDPKVSRGTVVGISGVLNTRLRRFVGNVWLHVYH